MDALGGFLPLIIIIVVFYFLMILPQQKQAKKRKEMLDALVPGNKIETVSRVFGTITNAEGEMLTIQIGVNDATKIKIHREGVARVVTEAELSGAANKEIAK